MSIRSLKEKLEKLFSQANLPLNSLIHKPAIGEKGGSVCEITHNGRKLGIMETIEDKEGITPSIKPEPDSSLNPPTSAFIGNECAEFFFRFHTKK